MSRLRRFQPLTNFPPTAPPPVVKISAKDGLKLANIRYRAETNMAKLKGVKK